MDGRPYAPDLYRRLVRAAACALTLPTVPSHLAGNLAATTRLAAKVARNADSDTYRELIAQAAGQEPLAIVAEMVRNLMFVAEATGRQGLHDDALGMITGLLHPSGWTRASTWAANGFRSRVLLDWLCDFYDVEAVRAVIITALAEPGLLDLILAGIARWRESRDSHSFELVGFSSTITALPRWIPVQPLVAEIHRQYPGMQPAPDDDIDTETVERGRLAAQALRAADTPPATV